MNIIIRRKANRSVRMICGLLIALMCCLISFGPHVRSSSAAPVYPQPVGTGWFIYVTEAWQNTVTFQGATQYTAYVRGYNANPTASLPTIILDFGREFLADSGTWAIVPIGELKHSLAWAQVIAQAYIDGYSANLAHPSATIAIGTNNGNYNWSCTDSKWNTSGNVWGGMLSALISRARVSIKSGNDIESWIGTPGFDTWKTCGSGTLNWFTGYKSRTSTLNIDYGNNPHGEDSGSWSIYETYQVTWGDTVALNMPEIYCNGSGWAPSWVPIRAYAYMSFGGVASLNGGPGACTPTLTWQTSWTSLDQALSGGGFPGSLQSYAIIFHGNF